MTTPYTYIIENKISGKRYYGVRYAKGCYPQDLGVSYFSSSEIVKSLIKEQGVENFRFDVRKTFTSKEDAIKWEYTFLRKINAKESDSWYNRSNGFNSYIPLSGKDFPEKTREKMRKPKSPEHRQKLKEHLDKNRVIPEMTIERREQQSKMMSGENNPNYGKNNHAGVKALADYKKSISGKKLIDVFGEERYNEIRAKQIANRPPRVPFSVVACPHCGKNGGGGNMKRYHFDNCKSINS